MIMIINMNFFNILRTSFHKFCVLLLFKNYKNSIIRIYKKPKIMVVKYLQLIQCKTLNSKFNCTFKVLEFKSA